jgi:hypothetical protein
MIPFVERQYPWIVTFKDRLNKVRNHMFNELMSEDEQAYFLLTGGLQTVQSDNGLLYLNVGDVRVGIGSDRTYVIWNLPKSFHVCGYKKAAQAAYEAWKVGSVFMNQVSDRAPDAWGMVKSRLTDEKVAYILLVHEVRQWQESVHVSGMAIGSIGISVGRMPDGSLVYRRWDSRFQWTGDEELLDDFVHILRRDYT